MRISDLMAAMERIAPVKLAEGWDNVGLLVGVPGRALDGPVLLTIDLTEAVLDEARRQSARAVVAYHPPIFHPVKRLVDAPPPGASMAERVVVRAIEAGIAVYSPHTALDATEGGLTDWLADGLLGATAAKGGGGGRGAGVGGDRRALRASAAGEDDRLKIVTFVPAADLERVRGALASAGAGHIGEYELCSFAGGGTGTFLGKEGTKPAVGASGRLESVEELRLEMVCPRRALALALATLEQFHPYEEPAVDVYPLEPRPRRGVGAGRRITLDQPVSLRALAERLKKHIGVATVQVACPSPPSGGGGGEGGERAVARIGVVPGAGASVAPTAIEEGCEVFVTGEMKHHEVNAALAAGMAVMLGGHTATERGYLPVLAARLRRELAGATVLVSEADRDPLGWV